MCSGVKTVLRDRESWREGERESWREGEREGGKEGGRASERRVSAGCVSLNLSPLHTPQPCVRGGTRAEASEGWSEGTRGRASRHGGGAHGMGGGREGGRQAGREGGGRTWRRGDRKSSPALLLPDALSADE